jgi:hypothetical protein
MTKKRNRHVDVILWKEALISKYVRESKKYFLRYFYVTIYLI